MDNTNIKCILCGKEITPSIRAISANNKCLCENCIKISYQTIFENNKQAIINNKNKKSLKITPKSIKEYLDEYVIGQDEAKKTLSIAVYNHYKKINMTSDIKMSKSNVLLIGPTGSGKTLLAQTIAQMLDVPFAIADCTSLTEAGYVGDDVETILQKLYNASGQDIEKTERGIIFLDETDKLAKANIGTSISKDPSGEGVQQALLKIIEGTVANVPISGNRKNPNADQVQINTENILFICGGAFPGLETIINKRINKQETSIGFGATIEKAKDKELSEALRDVSPEDLTSYGLIPELIGRIPVIVSLDELDEKAMIKILKEPKNSITKQYQELFKYDKVALKFTDEALKEMAKESIKRKTGARGLRSIVEGILKEAMFDIPSDKTIKTCIVKGLNNVEYIRKEKKLAC